MTAARATAAAARGHPTPAQSRIDTRCLRCSRPRARRRCRASRLRLGRWPQPRQRSCLVTKLPASAPRLRFWLDRFCLLRAIPGLCPVQRGLVSLPAPHLRRYRWRCRRTPPRARGGRPRLASSTARRTSGCSSCLLSDRAVHWSVYSLFLRAPRRHAAVSYFFAKVVY